MKLFELSLWGIKKKQTFIIRSSFFYFSKLAIDREADFFFTGACSLGLTSRLLHWLADTKSNENTGQSYTLAILWFLSPKRKFI